MTLSITDVLTAYQQNFAPVVAFNPATEKLLLFDFSENNTSLTQELINDTHSYTQHINQQLREAGAKYGIGGYAEHRPLYSRSKVFSPDDDEPRRLHLGMDIWGKPNTAVRTPLDGIVHSFAFNNDFGDYGATVILSHQLDGVVFHSLFGHLSLNSLKDLQEGERMEAGDVIGELGIPLENGHWPPHLHYQLILDLGDWCGDYPGVCKVSEKDQWLANCPDPDLVLQLNRYL